MLLYHLILAFLSLCSYLITQICMRGRTNVSLEFPILMLFWSVTRGSYPTLSIWETEHKPSRTAVLYCQVYKLPLSRLPKIKCGEGHKKLTDRLLYPSAPYVHTFNCCLQAQIKTDMLT